MLYENQLMARIMNYNEKALIKIDVAFIDRASTGTLLRIGNANVTGVRIPNSDIQLPVGMEIYSRMKESEYEGFVSIIERAEAHQDDIMKHADEIINGLDNVTSMKMCGSVIREYIKRFDSKRLMYSRDRKELEPHDLNMYDLAAVLNLIETYNRETGGDRVEFVKSIMDGSLIIPNAEREFPGVLEKMKIMDKNHYALLIDFFDRSLDHYRFKDIIKDLNEDNEIVGLPKLSIDYAASIKDPVFLSEDHELVIRIDTPIRGFIEDPTKFKEFIQIELRKRKYLEEEFAKEFSLLGGNHK